MKSFLTALTVFFLAESNFALAAPTLLETVDLSPGADTYSPTSLAVNRNTHKLYTLGGGRSFQHYGLKVVDTTTGQVRTGIDLGFSTSINDTTSFFPLGFALDDSTDSNGNKAYVVGSPGGGRGLILRFIDTATDTALTGPGTDLVLTGTGSFVAVLVNPLNHKVYVADGDGRVTVINGPGRQILGTASGAVINPSTVFNPGTNKFVTPTDRFVNFLDSASDTSTSVPVEFSGPRGAVLDASARRVYALGYSTLSSKNFAFGLYSFDANTGAVLSSTSTGVSSTADQQGLAFDDVTRTLYVTSSTDSIGTITAFDPSTLAVKTTYPHAASRIAFDGRLFLIGSAELTDAVGLLSPGDGAFSKTTVGYEPNAIAINSNAALAYVLDSAATEVTAINTASRAVVGRFQILADSVPTSIGASAAANRFFVTHFEIQQSSGLRVSFMDTYDGADGHLIRSTQLTPIGTDGYTSYISVDDLHGRVYVTGRINNDSKVYVLDTNADGLLATIPLSGGATGVAVNPVTRRVYVPNGAGSNSQITIIDGASNGIVTSITAASLSPGQVAVNSRTNKAYVATTAGNDHSVQILDGDADGGTFGDTSRNQFDSASRVAVDETTNTVFVLDDSISSTDAIGTVLAFDAGNNYQRTAQIGVGVAPLGMGFDPGTHRLFVSNDYDGTVSVVQADAGPAPLPPFANISTRLSVGTNDNAAFAGFIVTGTPGSTKKVLIRGLGPSLTQYGVSGALPDPFLELHFGDGNPTIKNDNWQSGDTSQIPAAYQQKISPLDSIIVAALPIGSDGTGFYTAILKGREAADQTGVALIEVYDLDPAGSPATLANISTRGFVQTGDNTIIAGIIVGGSGPTNVLLRVAGPSLKNFGINNYLTNPTLNLVDANGTSTFNDNWQDTQANEISATQLAPNDSLEPAIKATLPPGSYTAIVRGKDETTTGVAVVEAYRLP